MLRQQVSSAQSDLESNIEALSSAAAGGGDGTPLLNAQSQLQGLNRLQHRIANAHGGNLVAIRAEVLASIAATQVFVAQVRSATTAAQSTEAPSHAQAGGHVQCSAGLLPGGVSATLIAAALVILFRVFRKLGAFATKGAKGQRVTVGVCLPAPRQSPAMQDAYSALPEYCWPLFQQR